MRRIVDRLLLAGGALLLAADAAGAAGLAAEGRDFVRTAAAAKPVPQVQFTLATGPLAKRARQVPVGGRFRLVDVPLEGRIAVLGLERFDVFTPDAQVLVQGAKERTVLPPPKRTYFRGSVEGEPDSLAFLAVGEDSEVRGLVVSGGRMHVLGAEREKALTDEPLVVRAVEEVLAKKQAPSWTCGAGALTHPTASGEESLKATFGDTLGTADTFTTKASAQHSMVLAIETDFEFYALFNSVDAAAAYVGDLVGAISAIYFRDIGTTLRVNLLSLWTGGAASDPWTATNTTAALCELGTWWHNNRPQPTYPRATVHLLSGKGLGGGVAWVGVLCTDDFQACGAGQYGGGYGVTANIAGGFSPLSPTVVWDIYAVSHELGHNFGSPHTHCYNNQPNAGSAQPVDQCRDSTLSNPDETYNGALCYAGTQSLPAGGQGSIMSYCHLLGGFPAVALSFGAPGLYGTQSERVPQVMRDFVASRPPSCSKLIPARPADFNGDGRSEVFIYRNGAWLEFPLWPGN